ncbi:Crp/Fnr family transcriptional regulator [Flavobacterium collinsii]|uniref:cAMP-binding proteins - catabolite gene activator and regulatory subunit of cAMP-dependent protein kinases n=1 Tax=Flavobacterium collinsii TaxID=1114861 RepID=A0A9W4X4J9_9FLAO|nr:Crp/Fnr family transcriptional regulator [Flavobacterium collinsii]CAI2768536.1 cAMP-binding proteins - catabolite gene activator and regulatory subunit of cAMP-dependent protein kinases [Flavobacterium collinsii]
MSINQNKYLNDLKIKFESYAPISDTSWKLIEDIAEIQSVKKGEILLQSGQTAKEIHFIIKGALRAFITDAAGNLYNKNIFLEGHFAGSKASLLQQTPSHFTIEALEDSTLIRLNYKKYRALIDQHNDLKNYYIAYLEKNWVIEKEQREIALVMENATERYLHLLSSHPDISERIPLLHIASHLGITPTQLSRIRKNLEKDL